jgi:hypothetical protein
MGRLLLELKRELLGLQQKGRKYLSIDKLIQYCDIADEDSDQGQRSESADRDYRQYGASRWNPVAKGPN